MSVTRPSSGGPPARILVADDDLHFCNLLKHFLKAKGYEVTFAYDGEEALAKVREQPPHLLLLDIKMPKRDGVGVMKELQTIAPDLPVVLVTGIGDVDLTREALRLGATGYVSKPIDLNHLGMSIALNITGKPEREAARPSRPSPAAPTLYSLRMHHVAPGKMEEFHRLRREAIPFYEKHGMKVVAYWKTEVGPSPCVVSLTAFQDWAHYEKVQGALVSDPEFRKLMGRFQELSLKTETIILRPTDYSPMR